MKILPAILLVVMACGLHANPETYQLKKQAEAKMAAAITALQKANARGEAAAIRAASAKLQQAELDYHAASRAHYQAQMQGMDEDAMKRHVYGNKAEYTRRRIDYTNALVDNAKSRSDMSDEEKAAFLSSNEASLRAMHIDTAINEGYVRQFIPTKERRKGVGTVSDRVVDSKVARLTELTRNMAMTDSNQGYTHEGFAAEAYKMTKRVQNEQNLKEFNSIASSGTFRNPETGDLLPPTQQQRAKANARKALEHALKSNAHDGGFPEDFVNFFTGDKKDSRLGLANQISYENESNIAAKALDMIEGRDADPQEHFRAMAHVLNQEASKLDDFFLQEYLPNANDGKDSRASQIFNLGMGTAIRSLDDESEDGLTTVRNQIDAAKADAYRVAAILNEAASIAPGDLPEQDRNLLLNKGYVVRDGQGGYQYQVPKDSKGINDVVDVNLPRSPWLDAISVRSATETGAAMATGVGTATLASRVATAAGMSRKGTAALTTLLDIGASSGTDAMMNKIQGRDADYDKALLHNLTMAGAGKLIGAAGEEFLSANRGWKEAIEDTSSRSTYKRLMDMKSGEGKFLDSSDAKRFISNAVGLSSEAAIETAYQAALEEGPISRDAFMANLFSGAMSRTASLAMRAGGEVTADKIIDRMPPAARKWARENPHVLAESIERARKSNALVDGAMTRFKALKRKVSGNADGADAYRNPAFADHILDSLKSGDLSWSDLGMIAEHEGSVVSDLLHEVKDRRTEWAYGVREPGKEMVAETALNAVEMEYAKKMAEVRNGKDSADIKKQKLTKLEQERAAVIEQLGSKERDKSPEGIKAGKALSDAASKLFNEDVMKNGIGPEVKERAMRELDREYAIKRQELMTGENRPKTKAEMDAALTALEKERKGHAESILEATMIAPGSGDPTSDIDRSWSDPRVMQAMKSLQRDRLLTEANGVKGIGPTTAKAFDLNEYYNVMEGVKSAMPNRNDPEKGFANEKVDIEGVGTVTHDDAVAANSLAAAMSHMSPEKRALYKKNMIEAAKGNPEAVALKKKEFQIAERELAASEKRINDARKKVAEKYGLDPNSDEAGIYARDLVYGETMRKVKDLDTRIAGLAEGSPDWKKLQAERERLMNQASRDGIEAYTDAAGLDVIVNRMQGKRKDNGEKMSVADLWADEKFDINGDLKHLSERQLDSMMNDQTMMISEHLDAFMNGDETPHQTARALAKYGQRAALVAKMKGEDLPPGHPLRELYEKTSALIEHKGDPEGMRKALENLAGPGGTYRDGLRELKGLVENGVPGLKGYTQGPPPPRPAGVPKGFSSLNSYRNWLRTRDELYNRGGQPAVNRWLNQERQAVEERRKEVQSEKEELMDLSKRFLPKDFKIARRLEQRLCTVIEAMGFIPIVDGDDPPPEYLELMKEKADIERKIKELKDKKEAWEKEHGELPEHPDLQQIERELEALQDKAEMLDEAIEKGTRPPDFTPEEKEEPAGKDQDAIASADADEIEKAFEEDFGETESSATPPTTETSGRSGGIIGGLNRVTREIEKAGE